MNHRDIIEKWLEKQVYANKEYLSYMSFNSYLLEEFGSKYANTDQGSAQRYILLQWFLLSANGLCMYNHRGSPHTMLVIK